MAIKYCTCCPDGLTINMTQSIMLVEWGGQKALGDVSRVFLCLSRPLLLYYYEAGSIRVSVFQFWNHSDKLFQGTSCSFLLEF